ncbi:MAG: formyltetrahydrofolate-dependent phosphoribosylglycinamide formyltransferase [Verrucomicrobiales bacterium]|jgi:formyltetrahydrofolate-dependent phosphoribosylglycinamide formyltransferase
MSDSKPTRVSSAEEVAVLRDALEAEGKRLVFTNGCFDLLHVGHVRYLREARALGDALVLALNSDASVRNLKGQGRPLNTAEDRAEVLLGLESVDRVVVFEGDRATGVIGAIRPHIYAKGGDYTPESLNVEERGALDAVGAQIAILSLVDGKSTTATLAKMKPTDRKPRIAVLGSGKGSNLKAILEAEVNGALGAEVVLVISDEAGSGVLELAGGRGVFVDPGDHPRRFGPAAQKEVRDRMLAAGVDLVVLAGFMRLLKEEVLEAFEGRIVNIHPSLLPKYKGVEAWKQALEAGDSEAGCSVHYVCAEVDAGEIIAQGKVPILDGDTAEDLHERIQEVERVLFPATIAKLLATR